MNPPIPILYTIPNFDTAGSGRALLNVVEGLDRTRFAPSICVLRKGGRLEAEIERLGIPYFVAPFAVAPRPLVTLPFRAWRAAREFRGRGFALWHSFHYLDDYTEPLVARLAGARAWIYTKKNMSWNRRSWWLRTVLASRVAAMNSEMLRSFFASRGFRRKSVRIPPGVDGERYRPGTPRRLAIRERLSTPADAPVVGCVAQLVPIKGHPTLVEAMTRAPGVHLWLAGRELDAAYVAGLRRQVREAGLSERVAFLGGVEDVPALLAELDVFVLPTPTGEGLGVALLEGMASGLACVAADVPGPRDVIENGTSGILVPPGDAAALGKTLQSLAANPSRRRELGEAARQRAVQHFSIPGEIAAYEALYCEALGERRDRSAA